MATATPIATYSDREFLFRLQTLVIDGGTTVLRNIFDQRLQNRSLSFVLASEKSTIGRLRRNKTLTKENYDRLYPSNGTPTSSDFDISLIVFLLRHLPSLGGNQNYNWNLQPQTGDTSVEADIDRLRVFRNEFAHILSTTRFQRSSFHAKWKEIETVLLRLDQNSPTPNFSQTIDSYKCSPMDPVNEQNVMTMIKQWKEMDRCLETDMQLIKKDISGTKEDVKSIKKDFSSTKEDVKSITKSCSDTKEDVKNIKKDLSDTKQYVKGITKDVGDTKEDVKNIKEDLIDIKEDVKNIKNTFSDRKREVKSIKKDSSFLTKGGVLLPKPLSPEASGSEYAVHLWRDCLQMTDKACQIETARGLLALEILPDQAQVRRACSVFGRCSKTFLNICSSISEDIKSKSDDVIDVWAAYRYYEHIKDDDVKPVFVVITKKDKAGISENDFDIIERDETVFSNESEKVLVEVENDLSSENIYPNSKLADIEHCVSLNADLLMDKHRNLNIVSPSVKKSQKFGKHDALITDELCIALYVHIKGLIPIAEEPFPSKIGEFSTDVLEGGFKLFHGGPFDYHEQLKMGLAIHANITNNNGDRLFGTLGGFLDYPPFGMCALTCAHVVLTPREMHQLITRNTLTFKEKDKEVFQSEKAFGQVVLAVHRTGEQHSSGVDVALIKITQRHPKDGSFPAASNYASFDEKNQMVYSKGKVSPLDGIRRRAEVYKYGISTGVTRGSLGLRGTLVKTSETSVNNQPFEYRLHNQIQVLRTGDACFAMPGDSGALVFFDDTDGDSVAIGIVEGGHTNNLIVYVTPICEILNTIGGDVSMTKFIKESSLSSDLGLDMDSKTFVDF